MEGIFTASDDNASIARVELYNTTLSHVIIPFRVVKISCLPSSQLLYYHVQNIHYKTQFLLVFTHCI